MYDAVYAKPVSRGRKATATPLLNIRKWLKILIDRSLILGTVDRASLRESLVTARCFCSPVA